MCHNHLSFLREHTFCVYRAFALPPKELLSLFDPLLMAHLEEKPFCGLWYALVGRARTNLIIFHVTRQWLYRQDSGIFAPPTWPSVLPVGPRTLEEDKILRDLHTQWGMSGLAMAHTVVALESAIKEATSLSGTPFAGLPLRWWRRIFTKAILWFH